MTIMFIVILIMLIQENIMENDFTYHQQSMIVVIQEWLKHQEI